MTVRFGEKKNRRIRDSAKTWIAKSLIRRIALWLPASLFLGAFFFYPLACILALSPNIKSFTVGNINIAFSALCFTFYQASLSTLLTQLLGLPAAYLFARFEFKGKSLLRALTAIPFMLPTVVVAAGFNALLGPRGWINLGFMQWLQLENPPIPFVGTLGAILLAHVFYNTTIVIRLVGHALSQLDPRLEQAARSLGADPRRVFWSVTLPLLRPSILAAALMVFLFDFTSFGVILLLGRSQFATLEVEIYIQALHLLNLPLAAILSLIQLLCTLIFSILYSRVVIRNAVATTPRPAQVNLRRARTFPERIFKAGMVILLLTFFVLPLIALPFRSLSQLEPARGERGDMQTGLTAAYYQELFINRQGSIFYVPPAKAVLNSLAYGGMTVLLSLTLAFPVAAALKHPRPLERFLNPFLMLPLGASAVTLGLGFIISYGRMLVSPFMVPIAHTLIALPFVIRTLQPALASIPERLRQAAAVLGASPLRAWFAVDWPIVARATLSGAVFAFTVSLGEFGATMLVSRPEYPTIPMAIYRFLSQPGGLNYGQAMAMATILMILTVLSILLIERLRLPGTGEF